MGTILEYEQVMEKVNAIEKEKNDLMEWYKKRIEIMSRRLNKRAK